MSFGSLEFIIYFLPISVFFYWLARKRSALAAKCVLLAESLIFAASWGAWTLAAACAQMVFGLAIIRGMGAFGAKSRGAKRMFILGVAIELLFLGVIKYGGFAMENIRLIPAFKALPAFPEIPFPVGLSFITFSQIAFFADVYRGDIKPPKAIDGALGAVFFPKLTQGPITTGKGLALELDGLTAGSSVRVGADRVAEGIYLFVMGLSKKLIFADIFGRAVDEAFSMIVYLMKPDMFLLIAGYTLQIYFDFSGYSDMALGICKILDIRLPVNFNSPYRADSVTDFWRRWHMSLTGFFRDYVYFPLGGSRRGKFRTAVNIMAVFLLSGLWHGANWTFILWGALHGALQVIERLLGDAYKKIPVPIRRAAMLVCVSLLWLLFRSSSVMEFRRLMWHLFYGEWIPVREQTLDIYRLPGMRSAVRTLGLNISETAQGYISVALFFSAAIAVCARRKNNQTGDIEKNGFTLAAVLILAAVCMLSLSQTVGFIYNGF